MRNLKSLSNCLLSECTRPSQTRYKKGKAVKKKTLVDPRIVKINYKKKHNMYKQTILHPNCDMIKDYKKYRNTLIRTIERAKCNYYNRMLTEEKHNTGNVCKIFNEITKLKNITRTFQLNLLVALDMLQLNLLILQKF